jgi:CheY-like chemotaxis protein
MIILLCHWNIHLRKIISKFLARDGQEALDILEKQFPDVIILDVMMPMVDGFATLEQIKKNERLRHCKSFSLCKNKEKDIKKDFR